MARASDPSVINKPYTSKIIKAGALIPDTQILLTHWDTSLSLHENLQLMRETNIFGKASRTRIEDMLGIFKQRYLTNRLLTAALVTLATRGFTTSELQPILYFLSTRADALLRDVVLKVLWPKYLRELLDVTPEEISEWVQQQVATQLTTSPWGNETIERVVQGLLATLRDFDVLAGKVKKTIKLPYLPIRAFAFIAFLLQEQQRSGEKLLQNTTWHLFFLNARDVERLFFEAHQEHLLAYQAAGSVIRIDFPEQMVEGYANALTRTTL
jgi:hypothetical protein